MNQTTKLKLMFVVGNLTIPVALWYYTRPGTPWRLIIIEYVISLAALNLAIVAGARLRKVRETKRPKAPVI